MQVADTGADTKVKICFPRKLIIAKRGQISIWKKNISIFDNFHCKSPQADKLYCQFDAGYKRIILHTFFYHF